MAGLSLIALLDDIASVLDDVALMTKVAAKKTAGVLGDDQSAKQDSFMNNLLGHPHYTRPKKSSDKYVPEVLLSGNHDTIRKWRIKKSLGKTWLQRPDLLTIDTLTDEQKVLLEQFITEHRQHNG